MIRTFFSLLLLAPTLLLSAPHAHSVGRKLVHTFWSTVQHKRMHHLANMMSRDYQAFSSDGYISKHQELVNFRNMSFSSFRVTDFVIASDRDDRINTQYTLVLTDGTNTTSYHQVAVWIKHHEKWKIVMSGFVPLAQR